MHRDYTQVPGGMGSYSRAALSFVLVALLSGLLTTLIYQLPVTHSVDLGGYDAAYTRGFFDPQLSGPALEGSDGSARWTKADSFLLFPQAGWPAQLSLHMRARPGSISRLTILTNGVEQLSMQLDERWQDVQLPVSVSLFKPEDTLISIHTDTATLPGQSQQVGVLIDRASYVVGPAPILPAPSQLLYAMLLSVLIALVTGLRRSGRALGRGAGFDSNASALVAALLPAFLLLVFYRLQTPYPYPLRGLLQTLCLMLAGWLAVKHAPRLVLRANWLADLLALGGMLLWAVALWNAAQAHVVRSVPGVENDFRVFATRTDVASIFRADGFYNLGYPLLLWLASPFTANNPWLAGRLIGLLAALTVLVATWWLGRLFFGRIAALIAVMIVAFSPMFVQYALYLGSDMPFAAMCMLTLALFSSQEVVRVNSRPAHMGSIVAAGICAGMAFLIRHPGLLLLPLGVIVLVFSSQRQQEHQDQRLLKLASNARQSFLPTIAYRLLALYVLAFTLTIAPQLFVNIRDTGQPLYSQQAKNIWLAVLGDGDWGRWDEISNDISLLDVFRQSAERFLNNWWNNIRGFVGSGAEDTSEFGHAIQLRLLGFPANWLAVAGLLLWLWKAVWERESQAIGEQANSDRSKAKAVSETAKHVIFLEDNASLKQFPWPASLMHQPLSILWIWLILYVAAICVGFVLPRFFLPLLPIYALAAAYMLRYMVALMRRWSSVQTFTALGLLLLACLWSGFSIGTSYVLQPRATTEQLPGQDVYATAAVQLITTALPADALLVVRVPVDDDEGVALSKYSAIAHRVLPADGGPADWQARGASAVLWSEHLGEPPALGRQLGQAGPYVLYQISDVSSQMPVFLTFPLTRSGQAPERYCRFFACSLQKSIPLFERKS